MVASERFVRLLVGTKSMRFTFREHVMGFQFVCRGFVVSDRIIFGSVLAAVYESLRETTGDLTWYTLIQPDRTK